MIGVHVGNNGVRRIYHLLKERLGARIMMKKHVERLSRKRGRHGCTICTDVLFQIFRHDLQFIFISARVAELLIWVLAMSYWFLLPPRYQVENSTDIYRYYDRHMV